MVKITKIAAIAGATLIISGSALAIASTKTDPSCRDVAGTPLTIAQLTSRLAENGYRSIHEIEREGGCFEVEARDMNDREVELMVHAVSGEVLTVEQDD